MPRHPVRRITPHPVAASWILMDPAACNKQSVQQQALSIHQQTQELPQKLLTPEQQKLPTAAATAPPTQLITTGLTVKNQVGNSVLSGKLPARLTEMLM